MNSVVPIYSYISRWTVEVDEVTEHLQATTGGEQTVHRKWPRLQGHGHQLLTVSNSA